MPTVPDRPVVVVLNHPSWWDPLVALCLSGLMPDDRVHHAPIDAVGLAQYPFLERVGFFPLDARTTAGASRFFRRSLSILSRPESVLWLTAEGTFFDPRRRPVSLRPGIGHLAHRLENGLILTLAIEYPFWNDRAPEILVRFGPPIYVEDGRTRSQREWTSAIAEALETCLDELASAAMSRDPSAFTTLIDGTSGVGGVYDVWRRARAFLAGRSFRSEHEARPLEPTTRVADGREPIE